MVLTSFYFRNGRIRDEEHFRMGKFEGEYRSYYKNGRLRERGAFKNDRRDGDYEAYDREGRLREKALYRNGKLVGTFMTFAGGRRGLRRGVGGRMTLPPDDMDDDREDRERAVDDLLKNLHEFQTNRNVPGEARGQVRRGSPGRDRFHENSDRFREEASWFKTSSFPPMAPITEKRPSPTASIIARKLNAQLIGLHVVDIRLIRGPVFTDISGSVGLPPYQEFLPAIESGLDAKADAILQDFRGQCEAAGVHPETMKVTGVIDETIIEEGRKCCDWILLAQRGEHFHIDGGAILGSTAQSVVRRSGKPVLVTPEHFREIESMAVAYDGSAPAHKALKLAAELSERAAWPLSVVIITSDPSVGREDLEEGGGVPDVPSRSTAPPSSSRARRTRNSSSSSGRGRWNFSSWGPTATTASGNSWSAPRPPRSSGRARSRSS